MYAMLEMYCVIMIPRLLTCPEFKISHFKYQQKMNLVSEVKTDITKKH